MKLKTGAIVYLNACSKRAGEFATFDSTQLFLAAGRHGRLVLNQQLEFELEEISVDVVRGVFQAVRICRAGGGCVAYQPESSA